MTAEASGTGTSNKGTQHRRGESINTYSSSVLCQLSYEIVRLMEFFLTSRTIEDKRGNKQCGKKSCELTLSTVFFLDDELTYK